MSKWRNYRIVDDGSRVTTQLGTDDTYMPYYRVTSDTNIGVRYKVKMTDAGGGSDDTFITQRSYDGGNTYTTYNAAGGTGIADRFTMINLGNVGNLGSFKTPQQSSWISIDEGVDIGFRKDSHALFESDDDYGFTATLQDSNKKVFDGGWHYELEMPYAQSSQTLYTKALPIHWSNSQTLGIMYNSNGIVNAKNLASASGSTYGFYIATQVSVDGTNWVDASLIADDVLPWDQVADAMNFGVLDPNESSEGLGGMANYLRLKAYNNTTNATLRCRYCYFTMSVYIM